MTRRHSPHPPRKLNWDSPPSIASSNCSFSPMAYCDRCERWFLRNWALEQHKEDSDAHWPCDACDLDFESYYAREEHYRQSPNHYYCNECELLFNFEGSKIQHMEAKHWYCRVHDRVSNSTATIIILHGRLRRTDAVVHCRSSSPKPA